MRAMYGQVAKAMTKITVRMPGWITPPKQPLPSAHAEPMPSARISTGKARKMSMTRDSSVSAQPR